MEGKYKTLIIGCGGQGALADAPGSGNEHKVISYAHALSLHTGFSTFLHDQDCEIAQKASELWSIPYVANIDDQPWDVVIVATPDKTHHTLLTYLVNLNPRLVVVEKPVCDTLENAVEAMWLYKRHNIPVLVDYTRRFIPEWQELRNEISLGKFGKFIHGEVIFNRGWEHTASHAADFFRMMIGDNLSSYDVYFKEVKSEKRIWRLSMLFENLLLNDIRIGDMPVSPIYDRHMEYVIQNAYMFLDQQAPLLCDMEDGVKALSLTLKKKDIVCDYR